MLYGKKLKFWSIFGRIVPLRAVVDFICLAMASTVYLTPPNGDSAVYVTPQSCRSAVYHTPLSRLFAEYLCENSAKIKIVPGYLYWDQDELFNEKTNTQKSRDTVPLNGPF